VEAERATARTPPGVEVPEEIRHGEGGDFDYASFIQTHERAPNAYELYGPAYRAPTAAQVGLHIGGQPAVVIAGKALGARATYIRQYWQTEVPPPCGPTTITWHLSGPFQLPAGVNGTLDSTWNERAPHHRPALVITGTCLGMTVTVRAPTGRGGVAAAQSSPHPPPMEQVEDLVGSASSWPWEWRISHFHNDSGM
jgi:hypothetical protein